MTAKLPNLKRVSVQLMVGGAGAITISLIGFALSIGSSISRFQAILGHANDMADIKEPLTKVLDDLGTLPILFGAIGTVGQISLLVGGFIFLWIKVKARTATEPE